MERERVCDVQRLGRSGAVLAGQGLKMGDVYQDVKILCHGDVLFCSWCFYCHVLRWATGQSQWHSDQPHKYLVKYLDILTKVNI